jgi:hypothetical protein
LVHIVTFRGFVRKPTQHCPGEVQQAVGLLSLLDPFVEGGDERFKKRVGGILSSEFFYRFGDGRQDGLILSKSGISR